MPPLPREARVTLFSLDTDELGNVERRGALRAELCLRDILVRALRAPLAERRRALVAKPRPRGIVGPALRAAHGLPPRGTGVRTSSIIRLPSETMNAPSSSLLH